MPTSVRRQRKVRSLEDHCISLQSEINSLQNDFFSESDPAKKPKLQSAIDTKKQELQECQNQLRRLSAQPVWESLASLDYHEQVRLFRRLMNNSQVGAVLFHGDQDYGHDRLLRRILKTIPGYDNSQQVHVPCGAFSVRRDSASPIIQGIGRHFGVTSTSTSDRVVNSVANVFKTQTVVIVLQHVHVLDDHILSNLLSEFWHPLATVAYEICCSDKFDRRNHLYLFLTDLRPSSDDVSAMWVDDLNLSWKPQQAVRMPILSRFTPQMICEWINNNLNHLPAGLVNRDPEQVSLEVIEKTNSGVPERVFEYLCELCDINFWAGDMSWT